MRSLGIDYGAKRVGVAVSDESGELAFPLVVLKNTKNLLAEITSICSENSVKEIVVGESKNFAGGENDIMKEILPFVEELKTKLSLPVHLYPEFLTSEEAGRIQGKTDMHDASAAALILKHYLDTRIIRNHSQN